MHAAAGPDQQWTDYQDACDRLLGPGLSGLIYPDRQRTTTTGTIAVDEWSLDDIDENTLADDEDERVLDELEQDQEPTSSVPDIRPDDRRKYRRFAQRWVESVTSPAGEDRHPSVPLRMTVATLYLTLLAAGVWHEDEGWRTELRSLIGASVPDDDSFDNLPAEAVQHLCSLLAVTMATLRNGAQLHGGREADLLATAAWKECAEWVAEADDGLAVRFVPPATQPYAQVATDDGLSHTIELARATRRNPYAETTAALAEAGIQVNRDEQGIWRAQGGNPFTAAGHAATELNKVEDGVVVVVARGARAAVLVACIGKTMLLVDSRSKAAGWRRYELTPTRTPASLTSGAVEPPPGASLFPIGQPPSEVGQLSHLLGVNLARIAGDLWPRSHLSSTGLGFASIPRRRSVVGTGHSLAGCYREPPHGWSATDPAKSRRTQRDQPFV